MARRAPVRTGLFALALLGTLALSSGVAQAQNDPDDQAPAAEAGQARDEEARAKANEDRVPAANPADRDPAGADAHDGRVQRNPAHGEPGHVHGAEAVPAANPAHGEPGHVHGAEAAPAAAAAAPAGAAHGASGHATPGTAPGGGALNDDSTAAAAFFWLFALMMVGGSVFVITRRNLISAVMGMVGTFFAIAAVFTMLYAHFLAAIQVLVYAGAIMVLFVFVIMIMNKPEDDPWGRVGRLGNVVAVALVAYLLWRMAVVLWNVPVEPGMVLPPPDVMVSYGAIEQPVGFGTTQAIGDSLFHEYLFPFEAVSLVLLIAVIGALTVARPHEKPPSATSAAGTSPDSASA